MYSASQVVSGVVGLLTPVKISSRFKRAPTSNKKQILDIDCFSYSFSFFSAAIFLYLYLITLEFNEYLTLVLYSLIVASYNICWITQSYIFLDILHPHLRSTANGLIIFVLHLVGDSISPYWVGSIADACLKVQQNASQSKSTVYDLMRCSQISLYPIVFVSFFGGVFGLFMTLFFERDHVLSKYSKHEED
jgi:hypothetical protein